MNAIKATLSTSQPVITEEEFGTIFYKISELHELHKNFLEGLKNAVASWEEPLSVGIHFKKMVSYVLSFTLYVRDSQSGRYRINRRMNIKRRRQSEKSVFLY